MRIPRTPGGRIVTVCGIPQLPIFFGINSLYSIDTYKCIWYDVFLLEGIGMERREFLRGVAAAPAIATALVVSGPVSGDWDMVAEPIKDFWTRPLIPAYTSQVEADFIGVDDWWPSDYGKRYFYFFDSDGNTINEAGVPIRIYL